MTVGLVVDSSVLIAILKREAEAEGFERALEEEQLAIGWPTVFEVRLWTIRRGERSDFEWLDDFLSAVELRKVPFNEALEWHAAQAFHAFGKGRHAAQLNYGDCMAYATAKALAAPLLFKGRDFGQTDIAIHPASITA